MIYSIRWYIGRIYDIRPFKTAGYKYVIITVADGWSNYIHYKVRDEITYPFLQLQRLRFTGYVITYPCWV